MNQEQFAHAKELYFQIVDLPTKERSVALERLRESEPPEIFQEVASLIQVHSSKTILKQNDENRNSASTTSRTFTFFEHAWFRFMYRYSPALVSLLLTVLIWLSGFAIQVWMRNRMIVNNAAQLQTIVKLEHQTVREWMQTVRMKRELWAKSPEILSSIIDLTVVVENASKSHSELSQLLLQSSAQSELEKNIAEQVSTSAPLRSTLSQATPAVRYVVWSRDGIELANWNYRESAERIGKPVTSECSAILGRIFQGGLSAKNQSIIYLNSVDIQSVVEVDESESLDTMVLVVVGVRDASDRLIAALGFYGDAMRVEFEQFIDQCSFGKTGDCYLIDPDYWIVCESRLSREWKKHHYFQSTVLPAQKNRAKVRVTDPGGDVPQGYVPKTDPSNWHRTRSARVASSKEDGVDAEGYRDYRGRKVIGAWRWDDELNVGIIVEQDWDEAYSPLLLVERAIQSIWLIPLFIGGIQLTLAVSSPWRRPKDRMPRVRGYRLIEKVGEGGLGIVYRSEHELMAREAALKLIKPEANNPEAVARFEREVRLASKLEHPNAIQIYDFGVTTEGRYYYAMEFVRGLNLGELIQRDGAMTIGRALHILRQVCDAIREAHDLGLIHRDIKPQNIMVCTRAGIPDFVKVLDYGLVKSMFRQGNEPDSATRFVIGTPKFMAPERLESPWLADPRIDIFSMGGVLYYMLVGHSPVVGMDVGTMRTIVTHADSPHRDLAAHPGLEHLLSLIANCISPVPDVRPASARELLNQIDALQSMFPWPSPL